MTDKPYGARKSTQNGRCWSVAQTPAAGGASSVSAGRPCPLGRIFPPVRPCLPRELRQGLTSTARRQGGTRGGRPDDGDIAVNHNAGNRWGDPPAGLARMLTGRVPFPVLTNPPLDRTTARIIG